MNSRLFQDTSLDLMKDASEVIRYDLPGIPLYLRLRQLKDYPNMKAMGHWHEDLELVRIEKGQMYYQINGQRILLKEKDCLFVNSRQMHFGSSYLRQDCRFLCLIFHPSFFPENAALRRLFIQPYLSQKAPEYLIFSPGDSFYETISCFLLEAARLKSENSPGFPLEIAGLVQMFFARLIRLPQMQEAGSPGQNSPDLAALKDMVSFIAQNYPEKITLEEIARAGKVSRSKCCSLFNRYLQLSPVVYLNQYRLKVSCRMLTCTSESITNITAACGFSHPSYYGKLFLKYYGVSPNAYRKQAAASLV